MEHDGAGHIRLTQKTIIPVNNLEQDTVSEMNWDLSSFFPEFGGSEMREFKESLKNDISELTQKAYELQGLCEDNGDEWEEVFSKNEDLLKRFSHFASYIECLSSADSRNEEYLREEAEVSLLGAEYTKLGVELFRALREASDKDFSSFAGRDTLCGAEYHLERIREESQRMMSRDKEVLAAELSVDGIKAWGRLYDSVSGKLEFDMEYPDGRRERLPMSSRRSLMEDSDRRVRKAAFEGGNRGWETVEDIACAALNAISGTRLTLNRNRGIDHFLEVALFQSAITKRTLDAMFEAIYSEIELPRRILKTKASTMNSDTIAWYDLGASLPVRGQERLSWGEAKSLVKSSFDSAYPALGKFLDMVYDGNWIEWEMRAGKRPGGFCTTSLLNHESRIFMTYNENMGDVLTLAHEAGHAFHSYVIKDLRPYAVQYPMTLAESASTFGEMILSRGVMKEGEFSKEQKALILDMEVGHGAIYLMDIPVRFEFEKSLHEERKSGELSVSRLKELMVHTQRSVFGEVLEEGGEDPLFWASKLHFYITGVTFYNFPYTFGYLLSRELFSMFEQEGADFLPKYEQFLMLTGSDTAPNVARRTISRDLESPEFWVEAINTLREPLEKYEAILPDITVDKTVE